MIGLTFTLSFYTLDSGVSTCLRSCERATISTDSRISFPIVKEEPRSVGSRILLHISELYATTDDNNIRKVVSKSKIILFATHRLFGTFGNNNIFRSLTTPASGETTIATLPSYGLLHIRLI